MNPDDENNLFSDLAMDDPSMMLVDDILEIIKNEPDLEKADLDSNDAINIYDTIKQAKHVDGISVTNEISDTIIDPNEFFNDMYKSEVDYSSTYSSPLSYRSTPSPTTSNSSHGSDLMNNDYNMALNQSEKSINMYKFANSRPMDAQSILQSQQINQNNVNLETPPISPPSDQIISPSPLSAAAAHTEPLSFIQSASHIAQTVPIINHVVTNAPDAPNPINIIQGTLIPITTVSLSTSQATASNILSAHSLQTKEIKIQPKPIAIATKPNASIVMKTSTIVPTKQTDGTPKRVVLSAPLTNLKVPTTMKLSTTSTAMAVNASNNIIQFVPSQNGQTKKPKPKSLQDEIDERTLKKQMRMIKNRESACLSRKKKKEYVNTLEARLMILSQENHELKTENHSLKERLGQVTSKICDKCGNIMIDRIAKGLHASSILKTIPKKNAAFLLAFIFMVSLNVSPYISPRTPNAASYADAEHLLPQHQSGTRGLLWIDDSADSTNASNVGENSAESERMYPMCPASMLVNQTESIRLASELQRWIGNLPEFFNFTKPKKDDDLDLTNIDSFLLSQAGNAAIKSFYKHMKNVRQIRKIINGIETGKVDRLPASTKRRQQSAYGGAMNRRNSIGSSDGDKHVQIYSPAHSDAMKYATFFEEIHRQDDTFYVVSFRADHLLLPALAHNKTFRPKMSLMLPAWNLNNNNNASNDGLFTLMQIDCEVLNTSMIRIKESSIPENLKNRSSMSSRPTPNTTESMMNQSQNPDINRKRPINLATAVTNTPSGNDSAEMNRTDINHGFKSTNFDNFNAKKMENTVKNYKPYFLGSRANATHNGN